MREMLRVVVLALGLAPAFSMSSAHAIEEDEHAVHVEAGDAHAHGAFDGDLVSWQTLNVIALLAVLIFLYRKAGAGQALKKRREEIETGLAEAKALKEAADTKYEEYAARLAQLDQEIAQLRAEMVKAGEAERDRIVQEAEAKGARMRRDAQFLIEQQLKQLRTDLTREAVTAAVSTAEAVLKEKMTPADQQRLAREYLDRLIAMGGRPIASPPSSANAFGETEERA